MIDEVLDEISSIQGVEQVAPDNLEELSLDEDASNASKPSKVTRSSSYKHSANSILIRLSESVSRLVERIDQLNIKVDTNKEEFDTMRKKMPSDLTLLLALSDENREKKIPNKKYSKENVAIRGSKSKVRNYDTVSSNSSSEVDNEVPMATSKNSKNPDGAVRKSISKITNEIFKVPKAELKHNVNYTVTIAPFTKLLTSLSLSVVCLWIEEVNQYNTSYPGVQTIRPGVLLEKSQQQELIAKLNAKENFYEENGGKYLNLMSLLNCSMDRFMLYIAIYNRPASSDQFNAKMIKYLEPYMPIKYSSVEVHVSNLGRMFKVINEWFDKFKFFYEILADGNKNVPQAHKTKTSILNIVILMNNPLCRTFDQIYQIEILPEIVKEGSKDTITILEINVKFVKKLREWNKLSDKVSSVDRILNTKGSIKFQSDIKNIFNENKSEYEKNKVNFYNKGLHNVADGTTDKKVSDDDSIHYGYEDWDSEFEEENATQTAKGIQDRYINEINSNSVLSRANDEREIMFKVFNVNNDNDNKFKSNNNNNESNDSKRVCTTMLFKGACDKLPQCKFNHNEKDVEEASKRMVLKQRILWSNENSDNNNYNNHRKYNIPPKVNSMNDEEYRLPMYTFNRLDDDPYYYERIDREYLSKIKNMVNAININMNDGVVHRILHAFIVNVWLVNSKGERYPVKLTALADPGAIMVNNVVSLNLINSNKASSFFTGDHKPYEDKSHLRFADASKANTSQKVDFALEVCLGEGKSWITPMHTYIVVPGMEDNNPIILSVYFLLVHLPEMFLELVHRALRMTKESLRVVTQVIKNPVADKFTGQDMNLNVIDTTTIKDLYNKINKLNSIRDVNFIKEESNNKLVEYDKLINKSEIIID